MPDLSASALLPLSLGAMGALLGAATLAFPRLRRSLLPAALVLLGPPVLAAVWWRQLPDGGEKATPRADYQIELREVKTAPVVTDLGRRIHLAVPGRPVPEADLIGVENDHFRTHDLNRKAIVRTRPDPSHNCHGWIFTGGRYWIAGDEVDDILSDNHYTQVSTPAAGDLAVYRDANGNVAHSGVVISVNGGTLVESKWGPLGRYIHLTEDHPFGGVCEFHRSARRGHLLGGLTLEESRTVGQKTR
jgi:hypothetical protein